MPPALGRRRLTRASLLVRLGVSLDFEKQMFPQTETTNLHYRPTVQAAFSRKDQRPPPAVAHYRLAKPEDTRVRPGSVSLPPKDRLILEFARKKHWHGAMKSKGGSKGSSSSPTPRRPMSLKQWIALAVVMLM